MTPVENRRDPCGTRRMSRGEKGEVLGDPPLATNPAPMTDPVPLAVCLEEVLAELIEREPTRET